MLSSAFPPVQISHGSWLLVAAILSSCCLLRPLIGPWRLKWSLSTRPEFLFSHPAHASRLWPFPPHPQRVPLPFLRSPPHHPTPSPPSNGSPLVMMPRIHLLSLPMHRSALGPMKHLVQSGGTRPRDLAHCLLLAMAHRSWR